MLADALMGLFGIGLTAAYFPSWIGGYEIAGAGQLGRWIVIVISLISLFWLRPLRITVAHILGGLFVALACASLLWSEAWYDSVDALWRLLALAGVFMIAAEMPDRRPFYLGCALGLIPSSILVIYDVCGTIATGGEWDIRTVSSDAGHRFGAQWSGALFINPLFMAETAVLCAIPYIRLVITRQATTWTYALLAWLSPCIIIPAIITARGPIVALMACTLICIWQINRRAVLWGIVLSVVLVGTLIWLRPSSVDDRLGLWIDTFRAIEWWHGHGFGSFFAAFPPYAEHLLPILGRHQHAHNLPLEVAFELGLPGVIVLAWFFWLLLFGPMTVERLILTGFLIESLFAFPDWMPATAGIAAFVAGGIARDLPAVRHAMEPRGIILCPRHGN